MIKTLSLFILTVSFAFSSFAETEKETLSKARKLFEEKKFTQAIELYDKIPAKSNRWLLAQEEKAWSHLHLDQYDKALAIAQVLTNSTLNGLTGTEPYLLKALIQLNICDYSAIFQTLKEFKTQKRSQVEAIQELAKKGSNKISRAALEKFIENPADWKAIGPQLGQLPQFFYLDSIILREAAKKNIPAMEKRLKELAVIDNNENYRILQKLNLIEVESVQRVHIATQFDRKQGETVERSKYDMVFKGDKEEWLDEVNHVQATVNRCQKKSGRTM